MRTQNDPTPAEKELSKVSEEQLDEVSGGSGLRTETKPPATNRDQTNLVHLDGKHSGKGCQPS
ncbi:MAG TPA: hypothetical protein VKR56_00575 [Candidatus Cybelea sp.]|nr:hypothetical protein [Candidatus Cybelea sp.]